MSLSGLVHNVRTQEKCIFLCFACSRGLSSLSQTLHGHVAQWTQVCGRLNVSLQPRDAVSASLQSCCSGPTLLNRLYSQQQTDQK